MAKHLSQKEEDVLVDLVADFAERVRDDLPVSVNDYLARCPNKRMEDRFRQLAGVSQLAALKADIDQDR